MAPGRRVQVVHGPGSLRPVPVLLMKLTDFTEQEDGSFKPEWRKV